MVAEPSCYFGRLFNRCREATIGVCQYCGRSFCAHHGDLLGEEQQVCRRPLCQTKVADLKLHQAYLSAVTLRNAQTLCGFAGCKREPWGQCSHCQALFCRSHLRPRLRTVRREGLAVREPVSLCDHCWRRHQLWAEA